ncbi:MAG: efflux RND transporter periplasmic adaptor subunit [Thermodesulfobacteriota bacterium]
MKARSGFVVGKPGKPFLAAFFFLLVVLAAACNSEKPGSKPAGPPPPVPVEEAPVVKKDLPVYSEWVATTDGLVNATIRAQVEGYLIEQNYKEGEVVRKGQVLFTIDPRLFQAALSKARAVLAGAKARLLNAKANLSRDRFLAQKNAVSQKELDNAVSEEAEADAEVLQAQAAVEKAELDLAFTRIVSPVEGIAGMAEAQIGNLVGPQQAKELTTVSQLDPIRVWIPLSEKEYLSTLSRLENPSETPLTLILADGSVHPYSGTFSFTNREVSKRTGTILVAANFPNPGNVIRPGQFARVRALLRVKKDAVVVPRRAILDMHGTNMLAVIGPDNKVCLKKVDLGDTHGGVCEVLQGAQCGDRVVVEGIQKVKDGQTVSPKPFSGTAADSPN